MELNEKDNLKIECENIMLETIYRWGYSSCPQDFYFLQKYSLKSLYFDIINNRCRGIPSDHLEKALKEQASLQRSPCNFIQLQSILMNKNGKEAVRKLLDTPLNYNTLISILEKEEKGRLKSH